MKLQASLLFLCLLLTGCITKIDHRGHVTAENIKDKIIIGETTQRQIELNFGSPSSVADFGEPTWYYVQMRKEAVAFMRPEITDQKVVAIVFDEAAVVKEVKEFTDDNRTDVAMVGKETPTEGHSIGFFEQVLGNFGRFNAIRDRAVTPDSGPGRR